MNENKTKAFDEWNAIEKYTHKKELRDCLTPLEKVGLPEGEL